MTLNDEGFENGGLSGSAILDFLIFPKPQKTTKIDQKGIKIKKKKHDNEIKTKFLYIKDRNFPMSKKKNYL